MYSVEELSKNAKKKNLTPKAAITRRGFDRFKYTEEELPSPIIQSSESEVTSFSDEKLASETKPLSIEKPVSESETSFVSEMVSGAKLVSKVEPVPEQKPTPTAKLVSRPILVSEKKPVSTLTSTSEATPVSQREPMSIVELASGEKLLSAMKSVSSQIPVSNKKVVSASKAFSKEAVSEMRALLLGYLMKQSLLEEVLTLNSEDLLFLSLVYFNTKKVGKALSRIGRNKFVEIGINQARVTKTRDKLIDLGFINTQLVEEKNVEYIEYEFIK